jgi:hypothetical protein
MEAENEKDQMIVNLSKKNMEIESKMKDLESKLAETQMEKLKAQETCLLRELDLIEMSDLAFPGAIDTNSSVFQTLLTEKYFSLF